MIEFRQELLTDMNILVHCPEKEQADNFVEWLLANGRTGWEEIDYFIHSLDTIFYPGNDAFDCLPFFKQELTDKTIITYEEALLLPSIETEENAYPKVHMVLTGDFDFDKIIFFVNDLLDRDYCVELTGNDSSYDLKGYKDDSAVHS